MRPGPRLPQSVYTARGDGEHNGLQIGCRVVLGLAGNTRTSPSMSRGASMFLEDTCLVYVIPTQDTSRRQGKHYCVDGHVAFPRG